MPSHADADATPPGHRRWAIADGYIPGRSHGPAPELESHEACCILNAGTREAQVAITLYFEDREPVGPYRFAVPAGRTRHLRYNDFDDPAPVPRDTAQVPVAPPPPAPDWPGTAALLQTSAGLRVERIARRGSELVVSAEQQRYRDPAQALGRTAAVLDRAAGPDIHWFTLRGTRQGLALSEASIERNAFNRYRDHRIGLPALERGLIVTPAQDGAWQTLYQAPSMRFDGNFDIDYQQSMGGPDRFRNGR